MSFTLAHPTLFDPVSLGGSDSGTAEQVSGSRYTQLNGHWGPFFYGGYAYYVMANGGSLTSNKPRVFRSNAYTSASYSWEGPFDLASANLPADNQWGTFVCEFDGTNIVITRFDNSNSFPNVYIFSCATNTFGVGGPVLSEFFSGFQNSALTSAGDLFVFGFRDNTFNLGYAIYSAGTWGTPADIVNLGTDNLDTYRSVNIDSSDRIHVTYVRFLSDGVTYQVCYLQMDSTGTVTVPEIVIFTSVVGVGVLGPIQTSNIRFSGTTMAFTLCSRADYVPRYFFSNSLAVPSWNAGEIIDAGVVAPVNNDIAPRMDVGFDQAGNPTAFWVVYQTPAGTLSQEWASVRTSGTWGAPFLAYDAIANPGTDMPTNIQLVQGTGFTFISGSGWLGLFGGASTHAGVSAPNYSAWSVFGSTGSAGSLYCAAAKSITPAVSSGGSGALYK
jgi:hypothetical protein